MKQGCYFIHLLSNAPSCVCTVLWGQPLQDPPLCISTVNNGSKYMFAWLASCQWKTGGLQKMSVTMGGCTKLLLLYNYRIESGIKC